MVGVGVEWVNCCLLRGGRRSWLVGWLVVGIDGGGAALVACDGRFWWRVG